MALPLSKKLPEFERRPEAERLPELPYEAPEVAAPELGGLPKVKVPPPAPTSLPGGPAISKSSELQQIEDILSEGLGEIYQNLPADIKSKFKAKGEEIAQVIGEMIATAKVRAGRILRLIRQWLKMIPGVNRFFLEKEAAIKAHKLTILAKEKHEGTSQ